MIKEYDNKYWENETPETIKFGNYFMRCFDEAGKLQLGVWYNSKKTGDDVFQVKFVLDRKSLCSDDIALGYLRTLLEDWEEGVDDNAD